MAENEKEVDGQTESSDIKNEQESASEPLVNGGDAGIKESNDSGTEAEKEKEVDGQTDGRAIKNEQESASEPLLDGGDVGIGKSSGSGIAADGDPLVKSVEMSEFSDANILASDEGDASGQTNIDMILDISIPIAVELGRTTMLLKDVLTLSPGSIVELTKLAGDTVDLMIRGKLIARGEVVVVDDNFGLRITSICGQEERIKHLT
ncbi:MAG: flagellar motor switch protein FliN [Candidatus Anammoxibacter sp.]